MSPTAGPLLEATLIVADAAPLVAAYAALGLLPQAPSQVSDTQAQAWGQLRLAGCRSMRLARSDGRGLKLRLIELPGAAPRPTRFSHGWLALEILVRDVDALVAPARAAGFEVIGAPADLDVSPLIRAMQLIGPAGEMLYLTQVKAPLPPFELPLSSEIAAGHHVDALFIAVLSTPSRQAVLERCAAWTPLAVLQFETRVTVLNRALGRALDARWPVATLQWAGHCLFEVDEVQHEQVVTPVPGELPQGLAWIAMQVPAGPTVAPGLIELAPGAWLELCTA